MKFDRRLLLNFDWFVLLISILIISIGITNLYSGTVTGRPVTGTPLYLKQIYWLLIGTLLMILSFSIDYQSFERFAYPLFILSLILLLLVIPFGKNISGSKRWLQFAGLSFQPSELFKITLILMLSKYFKKYRIDQLGTVRGVIIPMFIVALPIVLILKQPDLGTTLIIILIFFSILFFNKIGLKRIIIMASLLLVTFPFLWYFLKDYQKGRILTFLNPDLDPLGAGYHISQSKIAIGSGRLWGKGFLKGTQNQLHFLPEQHTDFIFSVLAEEWGFVGSFIILTLYLLLILRSLKIASGSKDDFATFLTFGIASIFFWHVFINIGMSIAIVPVVGAPLPFMSYGGSSTITFFISIGLLINISMRRFSFQ